jgi:hypothetical protein
MTKYTSKNYSSTKEASQDWESLNLKNLKLAPSYSLTVKGKNGPKEVKMIFSPKTESEKRDLEKIKEKMELIKL